MPVIAPAIGAVASVAGGLIGSHAAGKAAQQQAAADQKAADIAGQASKDAQAGVEQAKTGATLDVNNGINTANQTLSDVYNTQVGQLQPYLGAGAQGVNDLAAAERPGGALSQQFSFNPEDLTNDPGYKFQLQQGMQAVSRAAAANGTLGTGGTLKALLQYGQGLAGTTFNQAYQRAANTFQMNRNNTFQQLMALAGIGQTATGQFNQAAENAGNQIAGNNYSGGVTLAQILQNAAQSSGQFGMQGAQLQGQAYTNQGNAQAAGTVGAANAWTGALGGVANAAQNYSVNQTLNGLYNQTAPTSTYAPPAPSAYSGAPSFAMPGAPSIPDLSGILPSTTAAPMMSPATLSSYAPPPLV